MKIVEQALLGRESSDCDLDKTGHQCPQRATSQLTMPRSRSEKFEKMGEREFDSMRRKSRPVFLTILSDVTSLVCCRELTNTRFQVDNRRIQ